jgi:phospholipid N-methyltransferase
MNKKVSINSLETIASNSLYSAGPSMNTIKYSFKIFSNYIKGGSILELGPAEGIMTDLIYRSGKSIDIS